MFMFNNYYPNGPASAIFMSAAIIGIVVLVIVLVLRETRNK